MTVKDCQMTDNRQTKRQTLTDMQFTPHNDRQKTVKYIKNDCH